MSHFQFTEGCRRTIDSAKVGLTVYLERTFDMTKVFDDQGVGADGSYPTEATMYIIPIYDGLSQGDWGIIRGF